MKLKLSLLIVPLLIFMSTGYSQTNFQKAYRLSAHNHGYSVKQTLDGGYIVSGYMSAMGVPIKVSIMKLDATGDTVWSKIYDGPSVVNGHLFSIIQPNEYSYIACGVVSDTALGAGLMLMKTDDTGNVIWMKYYYGTGLDQAWGQSVQQTTDGGLMIGAYNATTNLVLLKTDSAGIPLFTGIYSGTGFTTKNSAYSRQVADGGYILAGSLQFIGSGQSDIYVIRTDSVGNQIWAKNYGGSFNDYGYAVQQTPDGNFIIVGTTESFGAGQADIYLLKLDSAGSVIWSKTYGSAGWDLASSLVQTNSGGFLIKGVTHSLTGTLQNVTYLINTDMNGDTLWTRAYNTVSFGNYFSDIELTSDGGYVMANYTQQFGSGFHSTMIIKLDSNGYSSTCNLIPVITTVNNVPTITGTAGTSAPTTAYFNAVNIMAVAVSPAIYDLCAPTSILETNLQTTVSYTNPFNDKLRLTINNQHTGRLTITILDISGKALFNRQLNNPGITFTETFDLSFLANGIYLLDVSIDGERIMKKIVKE